ncbi:serine hydrolase domain-containing protein [Nakamurella sp.]|uniref:serine hydrolase domain-containing protein n=1 Tax=Nakamurella sp. TaxID=1869182 RepID=UPI0037846736
MTMIGFPPHPADRWSLATWQNAPANRWSFQHIREVVPTARVSRGTGAAAPLPQATGLDDEQTVWRLEGRWSTVAQVIEDTYTDGFLVLHRGQVVTERYPGGMPADRPHILMSVSKSVVGCLVGILADEGAIDVRAAVEVYVPELAVSGYAGATVQDVLDMRSGISFSETYLDPAAEVRLLEQVVGWAPRTVPELPTSMYEYLSTLSAGRPHGAEFEYRSCETDILGWICERATGTRLPDLLSAKIWSKLGCEQDMDAAVDPAGAVFADGGLSATLRDLGRFGQMLLDGGVAQGRPVVPASWIADSLAGAADTRDVFAASGNGTWLPGGGYRNQFWLPGGREVLLCLGIHGQMVWVEPARELVVVKLSSWPLPQEPAFLLDTMAAIDMIGFQLTLAAGLV